MQVGGVEILWAVIGGSVIMLTLAVGYVVVYVHSHRRIVQAQEAKLEEVRKSEEKFKSLFDNSLAGIMRFSLESWTISEANEALQLLSGCISKNDIQHWAAKLPPAAIQRIRESLNNAGSISGYEIQTTGMNGDPLWILFAARKLNEEPFAQAVVVDITKRKQYEEQITEQSALLDQTQDAIVVIDYGGTIQFWNAGAELMYGWSRDEADGRLIGDLLFTEPQREKYHAAMEDIRQFKEWNGEHHQVRNDRKEILVESRWRAIEKATTGKMQILIVNSDIT